MNRVLAVATSLPKTCVRRISTTPARYIDPSLAKIRKKQALFQAVNDVPVYIKGGPLDKFLYYLAIGLTLLSLGAAGVSTYKLSKKT